MNTHLLCFVTLDCRSHTLLTHLLAISLLSIPFLSTELAFSNPSEQPKSTESSLVAKLQGRHSVLKGEKKQWQQRAQAWFTHPDAKSRRKQMRGLTRTLKVKCYTCHTKGFKGYVDEMYLISLQMLAISNEFQIECKQCHIGKKGLSHLGAISYVMWKYSVDQQKECNDCHQVDQSQPPFKALNTAGLKIKTNMIDTFGSYLSNLHFSPEIQRTLLKNWTTPSLSQPSLSP